MLLEANTHFFRFSRKPMSVSFCRTARSLWSCSCAVRPVSATSSSRHATPAMPASADDITRWKIPGAAFTPKARRFIRISPRGVFSVKSIAVSSSTFICRYACFKSSLLKTLPPLRFTKASTAAVSGYVSTSMAELTVDR
ncbi:hypothetical protein JYU34_001337 [Plutella xylostella]|uniref:Uncharacterized protein n=1 Tax=Plutella xylostella TaxID=51655 RepID=A0ABQ7R6L0_PLUXY|nr:hypothetical protein JYU34_001337 [Plutella xylostella]